MPQVNRFDDRLFDIYRDMYLFICAAKHTPEEKKERQDIADRKEVLAGIHAAYDDPGCVARPVLSFCHCFGDLSSSVPTPYLIFGMRVVH